MEKTDKKLSGQFDDASIPKLKSLSDVVFDIQEENRKEEERKQKEAIEKLEKDKQGELVKERYRQEAQEMYGSLLKQKGVIDFLDELKKKSGGKFDYSLSVSLEQKVTGTPSLENYIAEIATNVIKHSLMFDNNEEAYSLRHFLLEIKVPNRKDGVVPVCYLRHGKGGYSESEGVIRKDDNSIDVEDALKIIVRNAVAMGMLDPNKPDMQAEIRDYNMRMDRYRNTTLYTSRMIRAQDKRRLALAMEEMRHPKK